MDSWLKDTRSGQPDAKAVDRVSPEERGSARAGMVGAAVALGWAEMRKKSLSEPSKMRAATAKETHPTETICSHAAKEPIS